MHIGDAGEVAEAQASQTVQVTPTNFSTYFDIDSTTQVATLKSDYKSDVTLELSAGEYLNAIHIDGASNLIIRGGSVADSGQAAIIKVNKVIEDANGAGKAAIFAVSNSTNVAIQQLKFDFACVRQVAQESEPSGLNRVLFYHLYGIFFKDSTGTISSNVMNDYYNIAGDLRRIGKEGKLRLENEYNQQDPIAHFAEVDAYCDAFGTPPTKEPFPNGVRSTAKRSSFRNIRVETTSSYEPIIDANGKVTNLRPISIIDNEIIQSQKSSIQVLGYYDALISRNVIHKNSGVAIDITGGASARVLHNQIHVAPMAVQYAPAWFLPTAPRGRTIEANLEMRANEISELSSTGVALGFHYCAEANRDGVTVNTNAEIVGNRIYDVLKRHPSLGEETSAVRIVLDPTYPYTFGPADGTVREVGDITECPGSDNEKIRVDIIGNTFEQVSPTTGTQVSPTIGDNVEYTPDAIGILVGPTATLTRNPVALPGYLAWFDVRAHYNEFVGYALGVRIIGEGDSIIHGRVDAANNYRGPGESSPDGFMDDAVRRLNVAGITYEPWLEKSSSLTGWRGDFGMRIRRFTGFSVNPDQFQAQNYINKLVPEPSEITVRAGDSVRLGVVPYGSRDIADNALIDGKTDVVWTAEGGGFREADASLDSDNAPDDRVILFTAPDSPGTYTIHATLDSCGVKLTDGVEFTTDCRATFTVNVLPGVTVSPASLTVVEGQTGNFDVALDAAPERDLRVTFTADNSDISFSPSSVTFTSSDWDTPRTVSIGAALDRDLESETAVIGTLLNDGVYMDGYAPLMDVQIYDAGIQAYHRINRLVPEISEVTVRAGDSIRLGVVPYGRQDIADNALIDGKAVVVWTAEGGGFREAVASLDSDNAPDDRVILFTAPDAPGIYTIHATLASCGADTSADCRATFTVNVRRPSAPALEPTVAPTNPVGDIPNILVDADGGQYEVFTPVEGGNFADGAVTLTAGSGAVPNGEIVGLRVDESGAASNAGMTHQRYTLAGDAYTISAVDESGASVSSYRLASAIGFCAPLPDALRSNISDVAMLVRNADGSLTVLATSLRISGDGVRACAKISSVPAAVAVGAAGVPAAIPTPTPEPTPEPPDAGGAAPSSGARMWLFLLVGVAATSAGLMIAARRRRSFLV